jgi:hypothetical protein
VFFNARYTQVKNVNKDMVADFNDWRLPTRMELMSLFTAIKNNAGDKLSVQIIKTYLPGYST